MENEISYTNLVKTIRQATSCAIQSGVQGRYGPNYHSNELAKESYQLWDKASAIASALDKETNKENQI